MMIIMGEWKKETAKLVPIDKINYVIYKDVIKNTEKVLSEYGNYKPSREGLVYWAGLKEGDKITITMCIAPQINSSRYNIGIDHYSNFRVVETLAANNVCHIAQVHSHPFDWVDHSSTDDEYASFKVDGLLSVVVPYFCSKGMTPIEICGILRFTKGKFLRLGNKYVKQHFKIVETSEAKFIDLRND